MTHMARRRIAALLAACMLLAAGCAQDNGSNGGNIPQAANESGGSSSSPGADENIEQPAGGGAAEGDGDAADAEADTEGQSGEADPAPAADEPPEPLYRLNAAYRFEPIDPEAADAKVVLLTFDDGPKEREMLESMLDTLDKHGAKAVFFVNGYRAVKQPELLKLIRERGQTIGNHSWDHIDLKKEDEASVAKQIGDVQSFVKQETGEAPKLFRPPFGSGGDYVRGIAEAHGLLYMTWSNGSLDWDASTKDKPDAVIANVLDQLHPGANILMHELPWTAAALDDLLTKLEEKGYGFIDPVRIDVPAAEAEAEAAAATGGGA